MFDSRFEDQKVTDEPVYKSELSQDGNSFGLDQPLFLNESATLIQNTIVESTIIPFGVKGSVTIPANTLQRGDIIETIIAGQFVKQIPANQTYIFSIKLGGYFGTQLVLPINSLTGFTGLPYKIVHQFQMVGSPVTPRPYNMQLIAGTSGSAVQTIQEPLIYANPIGYDNSSNNDIDVTVQMSSASTSFTLNTRLITSSIKKIR
jgi:hypothetical protein